MILGVGILRQLFPPVTVQPLQCGALLKTSESDVCRRQILTTEVDPRTLRVNIFLMAVDL